MDLHKAVKEGALAQMIKDAIADINYKIEYDLLIKKYYNGNLQKISENTERGKRSFQG